MKPKIQPLQNKIGSVILKNPETEEASEREAACALRM